MTPPNPHQQKAHWLDLVDAHGRDSDQANAYRALAVAGDPDLAHDFALLEWGYARGAIRQAGAGMPHLFFAGVLSGILLAALVTAFL